MRSRENTCFHFKWILGQRQNDTASSINNSSCQCIQSDWPIQFNFITFTFAIFYSTLLLVIITIKEAML